MSLTDQAQRTVIAAVIENRAREVGLAVLDLDRLTLSLLQFAELTRHYATTTAQLARFEPSAVVIVSSVQSEQMLGVNQRLRTGEYELAQAPRGCFDDTKAAMYLERLADAAGRELLTSSSLKHSIYLALGAAGAVLQHTEDHLGMTLLHSSLSITHVQLSDRVQIDTATAAALELVQPCGSYTARPKASCSLYAWLNHTCTAAGAKLLKVRCSSTLSCAGPHRQALHGTCQVHLASKTACTPPSTAEEPHSYPWASANSPMPPSH